MVIFGIAFTMLELILLPLFLLALVIGTSLDRRGEPKIKWLVLLGAVLTVGFAYRESFSFSAVLTPEFWKPVLVYGVLGLLYSVVELVVSIRRSAVSFKKEWESLLKRHVSLPYGKGKTYADLLALQADMTLDEVQQRALSSMVDTFVTSHRHNIVKLTALEGFKIEPSINRAALASYVGAWVIFWPFYLLSIVLDDLLSELYELLATALSKLGNRLIKTMFKDVFTSN